MTNKTKRSPRVPRTTLPPKDEEDVEFEAAEDGAEEEVDLQPNPNHLTSSELDSDSDTSTDNVAHNPNHRSANSNLNGPTLHLTSFSHKRGPLHPKPTILIDLRTLPNPPKDLRATQTGLSKSLRGWLVQNTEFKKRFDEAVAKIEEVMKTREEAWKEKEELRKKGKRGDSEDDEESNEAEEMNVLVGVRCEMGRHRSVAFVEELSRYRWPKPWNVIVNHRDVDHERTRESMKGAGRRRGKKWEDEE